MFQDLKEVVVRGLGLQSDDLKISGFDLRDALVGRSIVYEIHLEIDDKILPLKLLDDVNQWQHEDLPILQVEEHARNTSHENVLAAKTKKSSHKSPALAPFQLAGPVELWIQDANNLKLSVPHHIDGVAVRKVIIAEGAVVTVKGAKSVSLLTPIKVELPLTKPQDGFASRMLNLADHLRHAARTQGHPLSLSIVGPTSLTSPTPSPSADKPELNLLVNGSNTFWPIKSLNGSNKHLIGFDKLLSSIFGPKANEDGSFKLLKADVSAQTFVKIGFQVERSLGNGPELAGYPKWRTKPTITRKYFEVLAKVDGDKFVPEQVIQVEPVRLKDTMAPNVITGNVTSSKAFTMTPPKLFTL
ncbi:protein TUNICAMYCIN INDUCED 1-like [Bidens hawaiensis]|uniref:protein TUNICAMYCIN INDUCED 1-like n=1 Tax=Bidens hawaiensis TaxID=980011 RepID=UPI00404AE40D